MWDRRAQYVGNHDGDTVTVILDQGFYDTKQINIRLANVWAPELKQPGGSETKDFVQDWFLNVELHHITVWNFIVITHKLSTGHEVKTFDRYVAEVYSIDNDSSLNSDVMKFIADRGYDGGIG